MKLVGRNPPNYYQHQDLLTRCASIALSTGVGSRHLALPAPIEEQLGTTRSQGGDREGDCSTDLTLQRAVVFLKGQNHPLALGASDEGFRPQPPGQQGKMLYT